MASLGAQTSREPSSALEFYVVTGPTGVGKTEIAISLAERCNGEIVGADAFQIYMGLDCLTAKPSRAQRARIPYHLVDEIPLTQSFDAGRYLVLARQNISEIRGRGRLPIVTGGAGLYLRALTRGLADLPHADPDLRSCLDQKSLPALQRQYAALDPEGFATIDAKNPRRLVRAIEVCLLTGRAFSSFREEWDHQAVSFRGVALTRVKEDLYARINTRTGRMFEEGVEDEVRDCGPVGPTASQAMGLKDIQKLLRGEITRDECITTIQQATRNYAKRQMTWLRREPAFTTLELSSMGRLDEMADRVADEITA